MSETESDVRICLIGKVAEDQETLELAKLFEVGVERSETGVEYLPKIVSPKGIEYVPILRSENGIEYIPIKHSLAVQENEPDSIWVREIGESYRLVPSPSTTYLIMDRFEGHLYDALLEVKKIESRINKEASSKSKAVVRRCQVFGWPAFRHLSNRGLPPFKARPIFNFSMEGVIVCFEGIHNRDELVRVLAYSFCFYFPTPPPSPPTFSPPIDLVTG